MTNPSPSQTCTFERITPSGRGSRSALSELWHYRQVAYFLAWRNLKVRYKQALLGMTWVILQPLLLMVIFWFIFARLVMLPTNNIDYRAYVLPGLIAWQLFSRSLTEATTSILSEERLVTKVFFPRALLPLSSLLGGLPDLFILLLVGEAVLLCLGVFPTVSLAILPIAILALMISGYGISLWLSALVVDFRDIQYTMPFFTQVVFFLSPIAYSPSAISPEYRLVYALNPFSGVCDLFRMALLGVHDLSSFELSLSLACGFAIWISGIYFFAYRERTFVDKLGSGG